MAEVADVAGAWWRWRRVLLERRQGRGGGGLRAGEGRVAGCGGRRLGGGVLAAASVFTAAAAGKRRR